jgi:hypothetical protein
MQIIIQDDNGDVFEEELSDLTSDDLRTFLRVNPGHPLLPTLAQELARRQRGIQ